MDKWISVPTTTRRRRNWTDGQGSTRLEAVFVSFALISGCAANSQNLAHNASKGAVKGYFEGVASVDPSLKDNVYRELLLDENVRKAAHDLSASALHGAVDGLNSADWQVLMEKVGGAVASSISANGQVLTDALMPVFERQLRAATRAAMHEAMRSFHEHAEEEIGPVVDSVVRHAVDSFVTQLYASNELNLPKDRSTAGNTAVSWLMRSASQGVVTGLQDGFVDMNEAHPRLLRSLMREIGFGVADGIGKGVKKSPLDDLITIIALGSMLVALGAMLAIAILWKRYRMASDALTAIAHKLDESEVHIEAAPSPRTA